MSCIAPGLNGFALVCKCTGLVLQVGRNPEPVSTKLVYLCEFACAFNFFGVEALGVLPPLVVGRIRSFSTNVV